MHIRINIKLAKYIIVTYLFTWIIWAPWLFLGEKFGAFRIIGSFIPSLMGLIFIKKSNMKVKELLTRKFPKWVFIPMAIYSIGSLLFPYGIGRMLGRVDWPFAFNATPSGFQVTNPLMAILFFVLIFIAGGPLGEEIGWRGFLLPELEKTFSPLISGIIVGIVWTGWHLPLFIFGIEGYEISILLYLLQTIHLSILFTWLFHMTNGNLWVPILFHTIDNYVLSIFFQEELGKLSWYSGCYWGIQVVLDVLVIRYFITKGDSHAFC